MHELPPKPAFLGSSPPGLPRNAASHSPGHSPGRHSNGYRVSNNPFHASPNHHQAQHFQATPNMPQTQPSPTMPPSPFASRSLPSASPSPTKTKYVMSMSKTSDTIVHVMIGNDFQRFKVDKCNLCCFAGWWAKQQAPDAPTHIIDFRTTLPVPEISSDQELLETFKLLLRAIHNPGTRWEVMSIHHIWQVAHMQTTLGLGPAHVNWLACNMANFVADGLRDGADVPDGVWEKALAACVRFQWADFYMDIAARLAFLCGTATDSGGKTLLIKPQGGQILPTLCGPEVFNNIIMARAEVMAAVIKAAEDGIKAWIHRLSRQGCEECQGVRIGALTTALVVVGIYPQKTAEDISKSINQIFVEMDATKEMSPAVLQFARECSHCDEAVPTSSLFPIEDVLTEMQWGRHEELRELISFPGLGSMSS